MSTLSLSILSASSHIWLFPCQLSVCSKLIQYLKEKSVEAWPVCIPNCFDAGFASRIEKDANGGKKGGEAKVLSKKYLIPNNVKQGNEALWKKQKTKLRKIQKAVMARTSPEICQPFKIIIIFSPNWEKYKCFVFKGLSTVTDLSPPKIAASHLRACLTPLTCS